MESESIFSRTFKFSLRNLFWATACLAIGFGAYGLALRSGEYWGADLTTSTVLQSLGRFALGTSLGTAWGMLFGRLWLGLALGVLVAACYVVLTNPR